MNWLSAVVPRRLIEWLSLKLFFIVLVFRSGLKTRRRQIQKDVQHSVMNQSAIKPAANIPSQGKMERSTQNGPHRLDNYRTRWTSTRNEKDRQNYSTTETIEGEAVHNPKQKIERKGLTRYHQAIGKWITECKHNDKIGVLCGDKPWDMADGTVKSLVYFSPVIKEQKLHAR